MSELYEKSLYKLELDKVLEQLAECAGSQIGKESCRSLRPVSDLEEVQILLDQTTAASDLCTRKGNPSFSGVTDVSAALERADRGGSLQPVPQQRSHRHSSAGIRRHTGGHALHHPVRCQTALWL